MAIIFSIALAIMWMLTGLGLFAIMRFRTNFYLRLLLAPALGLAVNVVALFTLSRIGFPIKIVAMPLFLVSMLLAGYFVLTQRMIWKRRAFLTYCMLILVTIIPFVRPLLNFGFEWLAFVNGDMSYYSITSTRLLDYAYSELPISGNIHDLKDHSLLTWDFHNNMNYRTGAELFLAYLVGLTGLTAHQVYMPLIIAFNFCVVSGAGALSLLGVRKWSLALWTMVLVALSPMLTIEVTMQQLAQALGLALLTSLCVSYVKVMAGNQRWPWMFYTVVSFSSLAIAYFEIIPFFVLYVVVFEVIRWRQWVDVSKRNLYLRTVIVMASGILLFLNSYIFSTVQRIIFAAKVSFDSKQMTMHEDGISVFPYFFLPSNGALLWGWMPLNGETYSLIIALGLIVTLFFTGMLFTSRIRVMPPAQMSIVMLAVAIVMWISGNGYGLFKIAMFIQPFLLATVVTIVALFVTKRLFQQLGFTFLSLSFIPAQHENIMRVSDDVGSSPVAYASSAQLGRQLREIRNKLQALPNIKVFSDTSSFELFSLESYYFKGIVFDNLTKALPLLKSLGETHKFVFSSGHNGLVTDFRSKNYTGNTDEYLLTTSSELSVINRKSTPQGCLLQIKPLSEFTNHLMLKETSISASNSAYYREAEASAYQLEKDVMFPGNTMSAVGQYHVYEILGAIDDSRMLLSLTVSSKKNEEDFRLPIIRVVGSVDATLPLVGYGSARVVSNPINPRQIGSLDYLGLDFGRKAVLIDRKREGAMALFGKNIKRDSRKVVVYARDISYISPKQYAAFKRPEIIQSFPAALQNPNLEYSGIFEDGWISDVAFVVLQAPLNGAAASLHLSGMIPDIGGKPFIAVLTLKVNDQLVYTASHTKGEVNITVPFDTALFKDSSIAKIQLESSALQRLPNGDDRPVSMHLNMVGFK